MSPMDGSRTTRHVLSALGYSPAVVPPCRCAGRCRCSGFVPALLLERLERECEFFRQEL